MSEEQKAKKPYQSKTVLVNALVAIIGVVAMLGFLPLEVHSWMQNNIEVLMVVMGAVGTGLRLVTKDKVILKD